MWALLRLPRFGGSNYAIGHDNRSRHRQACLYGVDAAGQVVVPPSVKASLHPAFFEKLPPCLIGTEACASSHHWSRELQAAQGAPDASGLREALRQAPEE